MGNRIRSGQIREVGVVLLSAMTASERAVCVAVCTGVASLARNMDTKWASVPNPERLQLKNEARARISDASETNGPECQYRGVRPYLSRT